MENKKLKQGTFKTPRNKEITLERYIVENENDLKEFIKAFPSLKSNPFKMLDNLKKSLNEGFIILLTEPNPMHGLPTYCFESPKNSEEHPSNMYRC
jgi:hypothetical protein